MNWLVVFWQVVTVLGIVTLLGIGCRLLYGVCMLAMFALRSQDKATPGWAQQAIKPTRVDALKLLVFPIAGPIVITLVVIAFNLLGQ